MRHNPLIVGLTLIDLAILVTVIALIARVGVAPPAQAVVRAELIELVDAQGTVRAQLKTETAGDVVFRLRDQNGTVRVKLGASEMGSGLLLADDQTDVGVQILAGISQVTQERSTMITPAEPGRSKVVIKPDQAR